MTSKMATFPAKLSDYIFQCTIFSSKYSTLMSTVPLVLTIQIQACAPYILRRCLLFPWYGTDHSNPSLHICSLGTDGLVQACFILMHHYDVTTEVKAHQHHNKNPQLTLSYYSQHGHVKVKEPYSVTSYQEGWILLLPMW